LSDGSVVWRSSLPTGRSRLFWLRGDGVVTSPISPDDFDVREFMVPADGKFAIVTGDAQDGTVGQHAYRLDLQTNASGPGKLVPITQAAGWHGVDISPDGAAIIDRHSTLSKPPSLSVHATVPGVLASIRLDETKLSLPGEWIEPELFRITTEDGMSLPAVLVKPTVASEQTKCPVVIEIYGGPQAPVVANRWAGAKGLYRQLLARRGIAVLVVDNRSSAGRGVADTWSIKGRVGEVELRDLLAAVDWLKTQTWCDAQRLALRGWSFGGFLTLYAMTHSTAFRAGIAGGSVTDWREYDSFYTERYMGLPSENPSGYDATAPVKAAERLHGTVLLIHGEVDDNVHPAGTLRMAAALQKAGKFFQMMIYPGSAHAVHDPHQVWHLRRTTDRFLVRHLLGPALDPPLGSALDPQLDPGGD
jgi:dipeptidyl-peptidase-4